MIGVMLAWGEGGGKSLLHVQEPQLHESRLGADLEIQELRES
jgi:hypothetical protein